MSTSSDNMQPDGSVADTVPRDDAYFHKLAQFERRAAVDAVAGAVGHEIAHTLSFLRAFVEDAGETASFSSEDARIVRRETERLSQIMAHLRRLKLSPPELMPVSVCDVVLRAVAAVNAIFPSAQLAPSVALPVTVTLLGEPSLVYILLRDMLEEMFRRAAKPDAVEIRITLPAAQLAGTLEIWGRILAENHCAEADEERFEPWYAVNDARSCLGLSVADRVARVLGWKLDPVSDDRREGLRLTIPASAFCSESR